MDLFHAHIGGIDTLAQALLRAAAIVEDGKLAGFVEQRYAGWEEGLGAEIRQGRHSLADLAEHVLHSPLEPAPRSGRQEMLENLLNRYRE